MTPGLLVVQINYHDREDAKKEIQHFLEDVGYEPANLSICDWPREASP